MSGSDAPPPVGQDRERTAALLRSFGVPDERHEDYLNEVRGMIALAFDAYFASLRDTSDK